MQRQIFMKSELLIDTVKEIMKGILFQNSLRLYHIRWTNDRYSGRTMQIYILGDGKDVSVADCAKVNRTIVKALETRGIDRAFSIEVGTPGTERELFTTEHFKDSIGKTVFIKTDEKIDEVNKFEGMLKEVKDNNIVLEYKNNIQIVPIAAIKNARIANSDKDKTSDVQISYQGE